MVAILAALITFNNVAVSDSNEGLNTAILCQVMKFDMQAGEEWNMGTYKIAGDEDFIGN